MIFLGYNTNGFVNHTLVSSLEIISKLGYRCVAITLDNYALNPVQTTIVNDLLVVKKMLRQYSLSCVIETGASFLLNPWCKHEPTLLSVNPKDRKMRLDFLKKAVDIAAKLKADAVSFWSGKKPDNVKNNVAWDWIIAECSELSSYAENLGVLLAIEPEPGMFIESLQQYRKLEENVRNVSFGLTLDLGHAFITEDITVGNCIQKFAQDIKNIHIEDMKKNVHEHLFFGQGDMDFNEIFSALKKIDYNGPVNVELSRHSHNAVEVAKAANDFLFPFMH